MVKMASAILWTHSAHFCHLGCSVGFPWNLQNILFSHWQWTMWAEYAMTGCASQSAQKNTVLKLRETRKERTPKREESALEGSSMTTALQPQICQITSIHCASSFYETLLVHETTSTCLVKQSSIPHTHTHTHNCCWILLLCQENNAPNNSKMKLQNRNRRLCKTIICISSIFKNWTWSCASSWQHSCLTFGLWLDLWRVHIDLIMTPMTQGTIFALRWAKLRESWKAAVLSYKLYSL